MSCGILLALSDDPLSRITVAITKQEFSTIGYFYTYGEKIKVFLRDPFGLPLYNCSDLIALSSSPLLRRLALRLVKPELEKSFRLALTKVDKTGLAEVKEGLYELFGFPSSSGKRYSSLGVLSNILSRMGKSLVGSNVNTLYGSGHEDCIAPPKDKGGIEGTIQVLAYLASSFNQNTSPEVTTHGRKLPWQIQSYIIDEEIFLPLREVTLTPPSSSKEALKKAFALQRPRLEEGISLFLSMLNDPGFLFLISRGSYNQSQKLLQESLIEVQEIFPRLREVIKHRPLLEELEFQEFKISTLLGGRKNPAPSISKELDPLSVMKEVLLNTLEKGEDLDLRSLLEIYQALSGEELRFSSKKVKGKYFLSSSRVGIILKSGDRLDLPLSNPNLSTFDYETLLEILENLDSLSRDSSYDELRTRVAEELASYSSFSLGKH